jgi:hypothetical protein
MLKPQALHRPGQSVVHQQKPLDPSPYQQSLDAGTPAPPLSSSTVRYWSDISRVYYHPRSLIQLYDFELNSTIRPFESFAMGTELFSSLDKEDDLADRDFRPFVEECDRMDGIQMIATVDDAWGGFATQYLEVLRDEYPKSCIWLWGLQNPYNDAPKEKRQVRISNMAQTLAQASSSASMIAPLSLPESRLPPNVQIDTTSPWQVSAVFATAIETATLQSRISAKSSSRATSLWDMTEGLNTGGDQTLCRMTMRIGPSSHRIDEDKEEEDDSRLDLFGVGRLKSSTERPRRGRVFGQLTTSRGPQVDQGKEAEDKEATAPDSRRLVGDAVSKQ